jgi:hypothetical protein
MLHNSYTFFGATVLFLAWRPEFLQFQGLFCVMGHPRYRADCIE